MGAKIITGQDGGGDDDNIEILRATAFYVIQLGCA